ncbi:MAG: hypothetical protein ACON4H_01060 [Rubripirellula sp.]
MNADTIWLAPNDSTTQVQNWYVKSVEKLRGEVKQFDDNAIIIIEESSSREVRHVSSRVLWIEWDDQSDLDKQLCSAFANGRDQEVLAGLSEVLNQRPPVWRQQWLTMLGTVSAWRTHRGRISLELVSQLDKRPLPLMTVAWLPISWTNRVETDVVVRDAVDRIDDPSELVRLAASSWLLTSAHRELAIETLERLMQSERKEVELLAETLSWRIKSPIEAKQSVKQWKEFVANLPLVLQTGPIILLRDKLESAGDESTAKLLEWSLDVSPLMDELIWMDGRSLRQR